MKKILTTCLSAFFLPAYLLSASTALNPECRKQLIDDDWQFRLTVNDRGEKLESGWTDVDLPHDWSVLNDFDAKASTGNDGGYVQAGRGVYRKVLDVPAGALDGRHTAIRLDGAYMNAEVAVNGHVVGKRPYGYSPATYDITPYLHAGENEITVDVDNSAQKNSRWYSGSGIYRHVWLLNTGDVAVSSESVFITTPQVSEKSSTVNLAMAVWNRSQKAEDVKVKATIVDSAGRPVDAISTSLAVPADSLAATQLKFKPQQLALWTPDSPALYEMKIELKEGDKVVDTFTQTFGVRSIAYSAEDGFLLNGKPLLLTGSCVHHDNGLLGARSYDAAEARKVRLLKQAGFNAVRTSHNIPSEAFLDECDRQGLLVIDEAFDGWRDSKTPHDYAELFDQWWDKDVDAMVLRDRNHPSIMCWSIGNEVMERKKLEVVTTARKLTDRCRSLDPTRPVTSALASWDSDWEIYDPLAAVHDIVGYNYLIDKSEEDHQRVPDRVMWQTESYPRDVFANWVKVNDNPYIIGDFVWTGIDYLGESAIGRFYYEGDSEGEHFHRNQWPWHAAYCGDIDLVGERKPVSYYRDMLYNPDRVKLYMAVREPDGYYGKIKETQWGTYPTWESWTWPGHEGKPIEVEVLSHYDKVRLYLDGKLVGEMPTTRAEGFRAVFTMPYQPGTLQACGVDSEGVEKERVAIETAGKPAALRLRADRNVIAADNQDLVYVTAEIVDSKGRVVPNASDRIAFTVSGAGTIEATGSADIKDTEGSHRTDRNAWKGRAMAIVKSTPRAGKIVLRATSPSLKSSSITLRTTR